MSTEQTSEASPIKEAVASSTPVARHVWSLEYDGMKGLNNSQPLALGACAVVVPCESQIGAFGSHSRSGADGTMRRTRAALCPRLVGAVGICRSLQILIVTVVENIKTLIIKK